MPSTGAWSSINSATRQRQPSPDLALTPTPATHGMSATRSAPAGPPCLGARSLAQLWLPCGADQVLEPADGVQVLLDREAGAHGVDRQMGRPQRPPGLKIDQPLLRRPQLLGALR